MPCPSARALVSTCVRIGILGGRATDSRCSGLSVPWLLFVQAPDLLQDRSGDPPSREIEFGVKKNFKVTLTDWRKILELSICN
ncbi:hypothetical protein NDU88_006040 [Pleurodeles waltl]|uniref:Uncharacterized protein n=1 Tax=Pleurodeles waltl TaxID=8319 RepID=A0AAV7VNT6_PLEWA|nr:hypothetical protein NDU88_006040 [Pleurodeles waltl]